MNNVKSLNKESAQSLLEDLYEHRFEFNGLLCVVCIKEGPALTYYADLDMTEIVFLLEASKFSLFSELSDG